ncbi:hypothetical protein M569_14208, partial [Genlisea aurea]
FCDGQLAPTESRILLQVQQFLEYPESLVSWNNWTNFCSLPSSPRLTIVCSGSHVIELSIVGNKTSPVDVHGISPSNFTVSELTLSERFSLDSFLTVLTKLWSLQRLTLVSLGLWGSLPWKVNRFKSLRVLNMSSNFISGEIPPSISTFPELRSLVLGDNLFNGSVPDLSGLTFLEELDLSNNDLGPGFPLLASNLVRISLGNNSLRSEIPRNLERSNALQVFDVSSNTLIGPIPSFLFSLPSIQSINLQKNSLSGALDPNITCNANLTFVDVSNNYLIGKPPSCLEPNPGGNKTVILSWNCLSNTTTSQHDQKSYAFCQKDALAVQPPDLTLKREEQSSSTLGLGIVIGIIIGIVVVIALPALLIMILVRRVILRRATIQKHQSDTLEKTPVRNSPLGRHVPQQPMRMMGSVGLPPYNIFTLEEIEEATNNFDASNLLQEGSQDQMYKGRLRDGSMVLIKCLKLKQKHSSQDLHQHMEVVSKLRHRHLVSVLGHCIITYQDHPNTASSVFVVLEHVSNGCLKDHLADWRKREFLKWPQRMGIAMGIARGIQYLHSSGIFGNDLKIDNVLLDDTLTPRISGYNIDLPLTVGAESPLNQQTISSHQHQNPEKEDIYKLGVILIEAITGKPTSSQREIDDLHFQLQSFAGELSASNLRDLIDPSIRGTFAHDSLKTAVQITVKCLSKDPNSQPSIEDVLWHMQYSVQVQEGWGSSSGNLSGNIAN